jgi:hypothetical protein
MLTIKRYSSIIPQKEDIDSKGKKKKNKEAHL